MRSIALLWAAGLAATVYGAPPNCSSISISAGVTVTATSCHSTSTPLQDTSGQTLVDEDRGTEPATSSPASEKTSSPNPPQDGAWTPAPSETSLPSETSAPPDSASPDSAQATSPTPSSSNPNPSGTSQANPSPSGSREASNSALQSDTTVPPGDAQTTSPAPSSPNPDPSGTSQANPSQSESHGSTNSAIPSPSGANSKMTTTTRSTSPSSSPSATGKKKKDDKTFGDLVCQPDQWNKDNWAKGGMDAFLEYYLEKADLGKSAPMTLFAGATDFMGYHCSYEDCHFSVESPERCKKGGNSHLFFALTAYNYLWNLVASALPDQLTQLADLTDATLPDMANDFTEPNLGPPTNEKQGALTIMAGVFGALSGFAGGVGAGAASGVAGVGAGIATIGIGMETLAADGTAAARAVLEHGKAKDTMSANAGWFIDDYRKNLKTYATALLESPADEKNVSKYLDVFKDGHFAEEVDQSYADTFGNMTKRAIYSSSLAYLWRMQKVFVAVGSGSINGKSPCDLDLTDAEDEFFPVCDWDDTDLFFVLARQPSDGWSKDFRPFPEIFGVDKLKKWDLDLESLLKAARWAQTRSGFQKEYWTPERAPKEFKSDKPPPKGYLFDLPVCHLSLMSDPKKYQTDVDSIWLRQKLVGCGDMTIEKNKWPYGSFN